jgi:pimeloyl-ACP methyl ester carboxylesterase
VPGARRPAREDSRRCSDSVQPVELDTGHFPMIEAPNETAEILLDLALAAADRAVSD